MSLVTPTTQEVADNIIAQLEATLNQTIPLFPKAVNRVISQALALVFMTLYKYAGWIFLQMFVARASDTTFTVLGEQVNPLEMWGVLFGVGKKDAATQAELEAQITVTNQTGFLTSGTQLVSSDNGVTYLTLVTVPLDAATKLIQVRAVADQQGGNGSGVIGNLDNGRILAFVNTIPGVESNAAVTGTDVTGADGQSTANYRAEIITRVQKPPQGGAYIDYRIWGLEVPGILQIYSYTGQPGQVDVYVESATEVDGIPTQAQLDAVAAAIELDQDGLASNRPAGSFVNTLPIFRTVFDVTVIGIQNVNDIVQVEADITSGVAQYMLEREPYVVGLSTGIKKNNITQTGVAAIVEDIVNAGGGIFSGVNVREGAVTISNRSLNEGETAKVGDVLFS
jgi:uncharacterized phage protein gp47/JayE